VAGQGNCQPVLDALGKVLSTPTHIYQTMTAAPAPGSKGGEGGFHTETIYVNGATYTKVSGTWKRGEMSLEQVKKLEQDNIRNSNYSCRYLRDEPVGGEAAAVYGLKSERSGVKSDGQMWISKSKGLPLKHEFDIDSGAGPDRAHPDIQHHSVRYEYTNVQAPVR
jgi:hypothetical protein